MAMRWLAQALGVIGGLVVKSGDIRTRETSIDTGGGDIYARHLKAGGSPGGFHIYELADEIFSVMPDGSPAANVTLKVDLGGVGAAGTLVWTIDLSTGGMTFDKGIGVGGDVAASASTGVVFSGQATGALSNPLAIQAKNSAGTVVSQISFATNGSITITNPSSLAVPFVLSSGYMGAQGFGQPVSYSIGIVTTTCAVDWAANGQSQHVQLTSGSPCAMTFTAPSRVGWCTLKVIAPAIGTVSAITWPLTVRWASGTKPVPSVAGRSNVFRFYYDGSAYWGDCILNAS